MKTVKLGLVAALLTLAWTGSAQAAATLTVTTTADPMGSGDCTTTDQSCSLRQAVAAASSGDTVQLAGASGGQPSVYALTQGANIVIQQSLTIAGQGPNATTIDGSQNGSLQSPSRILKITGGTVGIDGVNFTGGNDSSDEKFVGCSPCNVLAANGGGAIFNQGAVVNLVNDAFTNNNASGNPIGGAVSNADGTLNLTNVSFTGNAAALGGALFTRGGTVTGNGVTIANSFGAVAAYLAGGTVSLTNTTFSNNGFASNTPGGIDNVGSSLTLINDTFAGDIRSSLQTDVGATTTVQNTIIGAGFSDGVDNACRAAGKTDFGTETNAQTANAITTDLGNNIDQDGSCSLTGSGDQSSVDPKLAPLADNGGATQTMALLAGSPAIDSANNTACPSTDQRGVTRPQPAAGSCDIGAFEAVKRGAPTVATRAVTRVGSTSAFVQTNISLRGEAGAYSLAYGTSPTALSTTTPLVAIGVISATKAVFQKLTGLLPARTYYVQAMAENASASTQAPQTLSFTTSAARPGVADLAASNVTNVSATITATVDPNGADTQYEVQYGPNNTYNKSTGLVDIGSTPGGQSVQQGLANLWSNTFYSFRVLAKNAKGQTIVSSGGFRTAPQMLGIEGRDLRNVTLDSGSGCPSAATVDWGDSSGTQTANVVCNSGDGTTYTVTASHAYAEEGHYTISVSEDGASAGPFYIQIRDAGLTGQGVTTTASLNSPFSGNVASFTDADPGATLADYTATIAWGDGTTDAGTIVSNGSGFAVAGSHAYTAGGAQTVTVTIQDSGGASRVVQSTITVSSGTTPPAAGARVSHRRRR